MCWLDLGHACAAEVFAGCRFMLSTWTIHAYVEPSHPSPTCADAKLQPTYLTSSCWNADDREKRGCIETKHRREVFQDAKRFYLAGAPERRCEEVCASFLPSELKLMLCKPVHVWSFFWNAL